MAVNLSIKNVPDELAERLRRRAASSHRSLQGELLVILEEAASAEARLKPEDVFRRVRELKVRTGAESASVLRRERNAR